MKKAELLDERDQMRERAEDDSGRARARRHAAQRRPGLKAALAALFPRGAAWFHRNRLPAPSSHRPPALCELQIGL